jgi:hypothetical protein
VPVRGRVGDLASIYSFNATGSFIWQSLASPKSPSDLICAIQSEFEVDPQQARKDVAQFLAEMSAAGLIEVCGPPVHALQQVQELASEAGDP